MSRLALRIPGLWLGVLVGGLLHSEAGWAQLPAARPAIDSIRVRYNLPSLAAAIIEPTRIRYLYTGGRRKDQPVADSIQLDDYFHLGSLTKGVTSLLAAKLVEAGLLRWDSRLLDVVPALQGQVLAAYERVTLADLLAHRAGVAPFVQRQEYQQLPPFREPGVARRLEFARLVLQMPPTQPAPGKVYVYSNAGYVIAALMLEQVAGRSWESQLDSTFRQMGLHYWLGFPNRRDARQPWGHWGVAPADSVLAPLGPTPGAYHWDKYLNPAVNLSMPLPDFARLVQLHLCGLRGQPNYLRPHTYQELHFARPAYAYGWVVGREAGLAGLPISEHDGSTGTFFSHVVLYPARNVAFVVFTNEGGITAKLACYALRRRLYQLYRLHAL